jgi:hypothetical protein
VFADAKADFPQEKKFGSRGWWPSSAKVVDFSQRLPIALISHKLRDGIRDPGELLFRPLLFLTVTWIAPHARSS